MAVTTVQKMELWVTPPLPLHPKDPRSARFEKVRCLPLAGADVTHNTLTQRSQARESMCASWDLLSVNHWDRGLPGHWISFWTFINSGRLVCFSSFYPWINDSTINKVSASVSWFSMAWLIAFVLKNICHFSEGKDAAKEGRLAVNYSGEFQSVTSHLSSVPAI